MAFKLPKFSFIHGIAFRYSIFFLLAILIILFLPLVVGYGTASVLIILQAEQDAKNKTNQTVTLIEKVLQPTELVPQTLARVMEQPNFSEAEILRIARDFVLHDRYVFGTCLAYEPFTGPGGNYYNAAYAFEKRGKLKTKMIGSAAYDYFKMDWYRLPKILNKPVWTEPYYDEGGGDTLMCTYSVPINRYVNGTRKFIGVLTMDVSLADFSEIVQEAKVSDTGYGILISRKGTVIVAPSHNLAGKNILDIAKAGKGQGSLEAIREMLSGKSGFRALDGLETRNYPSFLCYAPVKMTGWSFGILFPEKILFKDIYQFLKVISWVLGISIFILLLTTIMITRRMTRPVVKLVEATRKIGQGEFNTKLPIRKSKDEVAQLTKSFALMLEELKNYIRNLQETTMAKEKIESELNVAHNIQMGILPSGFATPVNWMLYAVLDPAKAVGGDLYDFFYLDNHRLCIAVGDVAGKGVPAALFMMVTRTMLRAKTISQVPINSVMESINRDLSKDNPNTMFVTFFAAIIDLNAGTMEYCNAGHNFPIILGMDGSTRQLKERHGYPLGVMEDGVYTLGHFNFGNREVMVVTTDGVTDALNEGEEMYGEARLFSTLTALAGKNAREITTILHADLKDFSTGTEQADDITILALQFDDVMV